MLGELLLVFRRISELRANFLKHSQNSHFHYNDPPLIHSTTVLCSNGIFIKQRDHMKICYNSFIETQHCIPSKVPNFKENCLPQNCLRQGKIPKSAQLKYFQTQLKSAYIQILHCSSQALLRQAIFLEVRHF